MTLLFSYGTLQQESVQRAAFGRRLEGSSDQLVGFARSSVRIEDPRVAAALGMTHHANVTPAADPQSTVAGMALEITDAELALADEYETSFAYRRVSAPLASGRTAWVYLHD